MGHMAESATMGPSTQSVPPGTDVRRGPHKSLRHELAHAYEAAYEQTCRVDTLDALEQIVSWLRRVEKCDGATFVRSMPMAFKGIGWPVTGNVKADRSRHRYSLARRLNMLTEMGVLESWEPLWKGQPRGSE